MVGRVTAALIAATILAWVCVAIAGGNTPDLLWFHIIKAEWQVLARRLSGVADFHDRDVAYQCETETRRVNVLFYRIPATISGKPSLIDEQFMERIRHRFRQVDPGGRVELTARFVDQLDCSLVVPSGKGLEPTVVILPLEELGDHDAHFRDEPLSRIAAVAFADRADPRICPGGGASKQPIETRALARYRRSFGRYRLVAGPDAVRIDPRHLDGQRLAAGIDWWAAATFAGGCYWYPGGVDLPRLIGGLAPTQERPQRKIDD